MAFNISLNNGLNRGNKREVASWSIPDFRKNAIEMSSGAQALVDGVAVFSATSATINGINVMGYKSAVKKGDVISFGGTCTLYAFPYEGELNFTQKNVGAPYTATEDGWLKFRLNRPDSWGEAYAYIDGVRIYTYYGRATTSPYQKTAIKAGQVFTTQYVYSNQPENTIFFNYDF